MWWYVCRCFLLVAFLLWKRQPGISVDRDVLCIFFFPLSRRYGLQCFADVVIPACGDLVSLSIDIWMTGEDMDGERLVVASDIGLRPLILADLQPPPLCRYLKVCVENFRCFWFLYDTKEIFIYGYFFCKVFIIFCLWVLQFSNFMPTPKFSTSWL